MNDAAIELLNKRLEHLAGLKSVKEYIEIKNTLDQLEGKNGSAKVHPFSAGHETPKPAA